MVLMTSATESEPRRLKGMLRRRLLHIVQKGDYAVFKEHGMTGSFEIFPLLSLNFGSGSGKINYVKTKVRLTARKRKEPYAENISRLRKRECRQIEEYQRRGGKSKLKKRNGVCKIL
ncbi:MAG: hypothetical protein V8T45_05260 [Oscillospiraceae bacterium]